MTTIQAMFLAWFVLGTVVGVFAMGMSSGLPDSQRRAHPLVVMVASLAGWPFLLSWIIWRLGRALEKSLDAMEDSR